MSVVTMIEKVLAGSDAVVDAGEVFIGFATDECRRTDGALKMMSLEERIEFLQELLGARVQDKPAVAAVLGQEALCHVTNCRVMFTLTKDGTQFRCWTGVPGRVSDDYIDSAGLGLFFTVSGQPSVVAQYAKALTSRHVALAHPEGATFWTW